MISGSNSEVARAHSVEEILSSSPEPTALSDGIPPERTSSLAAIAQPPSKGPGIKFDWKNFQEAVCCSYFVVCHPSQNQPAASSIILLTSVGLTISSQLENILGK